MNRLFLLGFTLFLFGNFSTPSTNVTPPTVLHLEKDTVPLRDRQGDYLRDSVTNPFYLRDPGIISKKIEYDPATNRYIITERIGEMDYRVPTSLTFEEYTKWKAKQQEREYFERLAGLSKKRGGVSNGIMDCFLSKSL